MSKFISLILRHRPEAVGIQLDEHGWADVEELIKGINRNGRGNRSGRDDQSGRSNAGHGSRRGSRSGPRRDDRLDMERLERIVEEDSKQRYSFNEDKTLIRANQGHSVPVDVELAEIKPPDVLWHGTGEKSTASIDEEGLLPMSRLYVHLSTDPGTARKVGQRHGKPVVYRIDAARMSADGYRFFLSVNGVWLTKNVPPAYMEKQGGVMV